MALKAQECVADDLNPPKLFCSIVNRVILQLQQFAELFLIKFANTLSNILRQYEIEKCLKPQIVTREDIALTSLDSLRSCDRRERKGDVGQHVEHIAMFGIDHTAEISCNSAFRAPGLL